MDWREVERQLQERVEEVCRHLLPNGKRNGAEWCVGNVNGAPGDSLRVNLSGKAGVWCDFAGEEKGPTVMSLWCHVRQQPFKKSIVEAKEFLGIRDSFERRVQRSYAYPAGAKDEAGPEGSGRRLTVAEVWPRCQGLTRGGPVWRYLVEERRIEEQVLEVFDVRELALRNNAWAMVFPYYGVQEKEEQSVIEQVIAGRQSGVASDLPPQSTRVPSWLKFERLERPEGKKQEWTTTGPEKCLWGMQTSEHVMFRRADHLLITEGEKDALSWASFNCGIWRLPGVGTGGGGVLPVSVPFGAKWRPVAMKTANGFAEQRPSPNREWLDRCWEWMQGFETIFVAMDMDEAGRKAAADIITEIGPRRCRLVELPENATTDEHG